MKLGVLLYLVIAVMFGFLQRRLIYYPSHAESIRSEQAQLQTGLVHDVTAETGDDLQLRGWHFLATGHGCETRKQCDRELAACRLLVLFFHGNAGDRRNCVSICQILTDLKASVFLFDYRRYGDDPGSPTEEGLAADARAVWKYATEQRKIPPRTDCALRGLTGRRCGHPAGFGTVYGRHAARWFNALLDFLLVNPHGRLPLSVAACQAVSSTERMHS